MPSKTKKNLSQGQEAYQRIVDEIRSGALAPGDRLTETDLAARFGISRTPIREAIRQLEADGLVVHAPRLGATIRSLGHAEISELYEIRALLEAAAAQFAARAASDVEIAELESINQAMAAATDANELYVLNQQFHAALLDCARNRFLVKAVGAILKTFLILGPSTMEEPARAAMALKEHDTILAALRSRDPETAGTAMRLHIEAAHQARLRNFRKHRPLLDAPYDEN